MLPVLTSAFATQVLTYVPVPSDPNNEELEIIHYFPKNSQVSRVLGYKRVDCEFDSHQRPWSVTLDRAYGQNYSARI